MLLQSLVLQSIQINNIIFTHGLGTMNINSNKCILFASNEDILNPS
jgi:hypothetical protein